MNNKSTYVIQRSQMQQGDPFISTVKGKKQARV